MSSKKPPKRSQEDASTLTSTKEQLLTGKARQYITTRDKIKELKTVQDSLSNDLKEAAITYGEPDGLSHKLELDGIKVARIATTKNVVDPVKALATLKSLGLADRCTRQVIDEKELELCFQEGLIGIDEIDVFTNEVTSYRIDVRTT